LSLYNTGARVSEIIQIRKSQVSFGDTSFITILGKGRKQRVIPIWKDTASILKKWFMEVEVDCPFAFPSGRGKSMTRQNINLILNDLVKAAIPKCPSLAKKNVTPHTVRHSTAMHLLQSGVDITVIALWLGHESIETTHIYVEADLEMKEKAINLVSPAGSKVPRYKPKNDVLTFLDSL
jgi:site-specific recombinase XerD